MISEARFKKVQNEIYESSQRPRALLQTHGEAVSYVTNTTRLNNKELEKIHTKIDFVIRYTKQHMRRGGTEQDTWQHAEGDV